MSTYAWHMKDEPRVSVTQFKFHRDIKQNYMSSSFWISNELYHGVSIVLATCQTIFCIWHYYVCLFVRHQLCETIWVQRNISQLAHPTVWFVLDLSFCGQHFSDFKTNILFWPSEKEWKRSKQPLTSLIIRSPHPRAMSPPSEERVKEWRMRVCQVQTTKRCYLTHPSSTCPLQWQWHHLNHLNPPQHDLWQVTRHPNAHTSTWDDCRTAYLAENATRLTTWFIQNYSSMVLLHIEHLPIVHCGPGN